LVAKTIEGPNWFILITAIGVRKHSGPTKERKQVPNGDIEDFATMLEKLKRSPAFLALQGSPQTFLSGAINSA